MDIREYSALRGWFGSYLGNFRENGALHPMQELKRAHSRRVADTAALLAAGLGWTPGRITLARTAGLLHDIGRFAQFRDRGSLNDSAVSDHGADGRRILGTAVSSFFSDAEELDALLTAVQYHNKRTSDIPDMRPRCAELLGLLRDADKLDIIGVVLRSMARDGFRDLPFMLPQVGRGRGVTAGVLACADSGRDVATADLRTVDDMLVMTASWVRDLNHPVSHRLAADRGLLAGLRAELKGVVGLDAFFGVLEAFSLSAAAKGGEMGAKEILRSVWDLREGPAVLTTVSGNGTPNSVYVLGIRLLDDGRIAVIDNYFRKTRANIVSGCRGAFLFLAGPRKPYQAKGTIEYLNSGPLFEEVRNSMDAKYPRAGLAVLTVEELYSGAEKLA